MQDENYTDDNEQNKSKDTGSPWWVWLVVGLIVLLLVSVLIAFIVYRKKSQRSGRQIRRQGPSKNHFTFSVQGVPVYRS